MHLVDVIIILFLRFKLNAFFSKHDFGLVHLKMINWKVLIFEWLRHVIFFYYIILYKYNYYKILYKKKMAWHTVMTELLYESFFLILWIHSFDKEKLCCIFLARI